MLIWPFSIWTPAARSTASSSELTARRAISESVMRAMLAMTSCKDCSRFPAVTTSGSRDTAPIRRVKSARLESPAATVTVADSGLNPTAPAWTVTAPEGSTGKR